MTAIDFHAHHSPLGAYATFTCGRFSAGGGLTVQAAKPADHELVIGWVEPSRQVHCLPFVRKRDLTVSGLDDALPPPPPLDQAVGASTLSSFGDSGAKRGRVRRQVLDDVVRAYLLGTDTWTSGDFSFSIATPVAALPDPDRDGGLALARAAIPAITVRLTLDNRTSKVPRKLIFALGPNQGCHVIDGVGDGVLAAGWGRDAAVAAPAAPGRELLLEWSETDFLATGRINHLGSMCGFTQEVAAGVIGVLDLVLVTHRQGSVTTGMDASFWYLRAFPTIETAINAAVERIGDLRAAAEAMDRDARWLALDADRRHLVAHAERSYWGNTWLLDRGGKPMWVVLEGEYAMHNTFDLTVDMVFYELARNPWTVANVLDQFVDRYSYHDTLARPVTGAERHGHHTFARDPAQIFAYVPAPAESGLPGGISFCHDMGVGGHFTAQGRSSYECSRLAGCFSYMTAEQLLNWILCGASYLLAPGGEAALAWGKDRRHIFAACLESLLNRDDPDPARRNGVISLDSSRCDGGWEITTYDSLDPSLGQARNNLYLAVKGFAAWLGLERVFTLLGDAGRAAEARAGAERAARTVASRFDPKLGYIPAVFEAGNVSAIIPAIEGLSFPLAWGLKPALAGDGPYADLIAALDRHLRAVLKPGLCLFPDQGWKLSSTSGNSWLSKIFLCQVVAERVFGLAPAQASHAAHWRWQVEGSKDWAMTDQCLDGVACGSRYYPRCVTADLWLQG